MNFISRSKLWLGTTLCVVGLVILACAVFRPRVVLGEYSLGAGYKIAPLHEDIAGEDPPGVVLASELRERVLERVRETDSRLAAANARDARFEFRVFSDEGGRRWLEHRFVGYSTVRWDLPKWSFIHGVPESDDIKRVNGVMEAAIADELRDRGWARVGD